MGATQKVFHGGQKFFTPLPQVSACGLSLLYRLLFLLLALLPVISDLGARTQSSEHSERKCFAHFPV